MSISVFRRLRHGVADDSGAAAVEFAVWLLVLAYPLLNAVDIGLYTFRKMEVGNAGQMAAQAIYNTCSQSYASPFVTGCGSTLTAARDSAAQSTSLGSAVSVTDTSECVGGTVRSGTQTTCPSTNGDYIAVTVSYTYTPAFRAASITSLLNTNIKRTTWMRMA